MNQINKFILAVGLFFSVYANNSIAQKEQLSQELKDRYYSLNISVGKVDTSVFAAMKNANVLHPTKLYDICGTYLNDSLMNEAAIVYFIARNRFQLYNRTNPKYEPSGDGALAGSLAYLYGESINEYLNQNLDNFSEILRMSAEWYRDNKTVYFKDKEYDTIYGKQVSGLFANSNELKSSPEKYINVLEQERLEIEAIMQEMEEEEGQEVVKTPTSEVPQVFFMNLSGDSFDVEIGNEIAAVAHGYYDTHVECNNGTIKQVESNPLSYYVFPDKIGECEIKIYGITESGKKVMLGVWTVSVKKK